MQKNKSKASTTPLWIIGSFLGLTEVVAGFLAANTSREIQIQLVWFVCGFPILVAIGFFIVLWAKPYVFYPPTEFGKDQNVGAYVSAMMGKPETSLVRAASDEGKQAPPTMETESKLAEIQDKVVESKQVKSANQTTQEDEIADLNMKMFISLHERKKEEGQKAFSELMRLEKNSQKRQTYEVDFAFLRYIFLEEAEAFSELVSFTKIPDVSFSAFSKIGYALMRSRDYGRASEAFQSSLDLAPFEAKTECLIRLADCLAKDDKAELAISRLTTALVDVQDEKDRSKIYEGLGIIYESIGNFQLRALALEKAIEFRPTDTDLRFKVAWTYSQIGIKHSAFLHYSNLLNLKPDSEAALNNLGVEADRLGLPGMSIEKYRKSLELKNSLAGANLASRYLNAGFFGEARRVLDSAKNLPNIHPNIGTVFASIVTKEEDEGKRCDAILKRGQKEQKFFKTISESYFVSRKSTNCFSGRWRSEDGVEFEILLEGVRISSQWSIGEKRFFLSGICSNSGSMITFKEGSSSPVALIVGSPSESQGYAYIYPDGNRMSWMLFTSNDIAFRDFSRVSGSPI